MKKKFDESEKISIRAEKKLLDHWKRIAMSYTRQEGKLYTVSELIRDTLEQVFPMPKQMDFTENVDKNKRNPASAKIKGEGKKPLS